MVYDCGFIADPSVCRILYEFAFPWIFSFAIIFGLLLRSNIFGDTKDKTARGVSGIIGLVAGFLIIMSYGPAMGVFLANISGETVMFATVLMGIVLVITLINPNLLFNFGMERGEDGKPGKIGLKAIGLIVVLFFIAWLIMGGTVGGTSWYSLYLTQDLVAFIVILLVIGAMGWLIGVNEEKESKTEEQKTAGQ